jgi:ribosomal protein S12 methylthiotransferase
LLAFLEEAQLDRVGCFAYSPVDGASANALPDPVPDEVKEQRRERFMRLQARISAHKLQRKIGQTLTVLVDEVGGRRAVARSAADAPEIDGLVYIEDGRGLAAGQFASVTVRRADEHDLYATRAE